MNIKQITFASVLFSLSLGVQAQQKLSDGTVLDGLTVNQSAILELASKNKGLLHTRVALESTALASPVQAHVAGLMVYNTERRNDVVPGIYYNDGTKWVLASAGKATSISYNPVTFELLFVDESGTPVTIDFKEVVKKNETVTTLVSLGKGLYEYTSENNTKTLINVPGDVINNFETIIGEENVKNEIIKLIKNIGGNVYYDGDKFTYINENGEVKEITVKEIVKANETETILRANADGTYTYFNEKAIDADGKVIEDKGIIINIPASVVENFENIYNQIVNEEITVDGTHYNTFEEYLTTIVNSNTNFKDNDFIAVTGKGTAADPYEITIKEGDKNSMLITNDAGELEWATIESIVKSNETETILRANADGTYTYFNEKAIDADGKVIEANGVVINIPASVVENFENIYNQIVNEEIKVNGETYNTFEEYLTTIVNNNTNFEDNDFITVTGKGTAGNPYEITIKEGDKNSMLITNDAGELEWATIESIVKSNETETILRANTDGTYTYFNEKAIDADGKVIEANGVVINISASVVENFENIYNQIVNEEITVDGTHYNTFEEYLTTIVNNNTNFEDNDFITVTGKGTADNPYEITIKEGDKNSMLITNDAGELEWATIESIVKSNETETILRANADGTYTYFNEKAIDAEGKVIEANGVVINIPASVVENFENIYNQIVNEEITVDGTHYNTFEEYLTTIVNNNTNFKDNDFITVTGKGTADNPYEITIKEGDKNSMLITNAAGELEWATIEDIVNNNITKGSLTVNGGLAFTGTTTGVDALLADISIEIKDGGVTTDKIAGGNAGDILTTATDGKVIWQSKKDATTNALTLEGNKLTSTVNGVASDVALTDANISSGKGITGTGITVGGGAGSTLKDVTLAITAGDEGQVLVTEGSTTTWKNLADITVETTNSLTSTGNTMKSTVNGKEATATIINSVANSLDSDNKLITTVNGVPSGALDLTSAIQAGQEKTVVVGIDGVTATPSKVDKTTTYTVSTKLTGDVTGAANNTTVSKLQGKELDASNPVAGNVLVFEGGKWITKTPSVDAGQVTNGKTLTGNGITVNADATPAGDGVGALLKDVVLGIADNAITTAKLADKAVTAGKLDGGAGVADRVGVADVDGNITYKTLDEVVKANQKTVTVVDGTNTTVNETVTGNNTEYKVNVSDTAINEAITLAGDVTGKVGETNLAAIQGTPVIANGTKTAGQALVFDGTNWIPGKPLVDVADVSNAKDLKAADADEATIEVVTGGEKAVLVETSLRVKEESITTGHIQDGTIKPEDIAKAGSNQVLVTGADNKPVWKDQNKVAPQFFYMPAVIFDTGATGTATRDLYQEYVNQFTGGSKTEANPVAYPISHGPAGTTPVQYTGGIVGSTGAPADIAVLDKGDLYYYVTYYDEAVFENLSIDADGKLTYTVKAGATPSSYMNIVFVIK